MSELIAYRIKGVTLGDTHDVYIKSEVDKVIADLEESHKKEVEQLLMEIVELKVIANDACLERDDNQKVIDELEDENRKLQSKITLASLAEDCSSLRYKRCNYCSELQRQKYKRCLAMARIAQDDWHLHNSFYAMGHQEFEKRKCSFYEKWRKRWLGIAEKFKEAK